MGYIYKVAVPDENWPSVAELNAALEAGGRAIRLPAGEGPFATRPDESLEVLVDGDPHVVDSRDYVFDPANDQFELRDIMQEAGMDVARLDGAHIFSVTAHADPRDWQASGALLECLVLDFGGYGMDFQTTDAGTADWGASIPDRMKKGREDYLAQVARIQSEDAAYAAAPTRQGLFERFTAIFGNRGSPPGEHREHK